MANDPFASLTCERTLTPVEALLNGGLNGACLDFSITPLGAFFFIAAFGILLACLQAVVKALLFGRNSAEPTRRREHEPGLSLREAANRARALRNDSP
ncbi:hypothetical protein [Oceaniovalibus sp. ACAM 378]|uniref:hypothetical protein n=1 Tax=Oceaniovalibus sp. ACAM 378 TaxID=2599923 RepID=UPI0011DA5D27|nr:hypothetical protein [Oceaniovalibus sp. ACAM 378]TYB89113.1 hypothetical protein FQ320_09335 [Oceaniovalibus sp. ACAM 378]